MFFLNKKHKDTGVIIDIGSGSVSIAYISYKKDKPEILYAQREEMPLTSFTDFEKYLSNVASLTELLSSYLIHYKKFKNTEKIFCFLPAFLHFTQIRKINKKYTNKKKITKELLEDITNEEVRKIIEEENLIEKDKPKYFILDKNITKILLNGYEIKNPYSKTAEELELSLFVSYTPNDVLEKIINISEKVFHRDDIEFHSSVYATHDTLRNIFNNYENFGILNISGETSEIILIKNSDIENIGVYPFGRRTFLKRISKILSINTNDSETILELYLNEKKSKKITNRVEEAIESARRTWKESFYNALNKNNMSNKMPKHIVITGESLFSKLMIKWMKEDSRDELDINVLDTEKNLKPLVEFKVLPKNVQSLLIKSIYTNKLL